MTYQSKFSVINYLFIVYFHHAFIFQSLEMYFVGVED